MGSTGFIAFINNGHTGWGKSSLAKLAYNYNKHTLWLFNIAMENGPFIDGLPIKNWIFHGYVKQPDGSV